jgi:N-acetylneuraminic acid mutarotase
MKKTYYLFWCLIFYSFSCLGQWEKKNNLPYKINSKVNFSVGNKGYMITGYYNEYLKTTLEYDKINNTWTKKTDFPGMERDGAIGFTINGKGYVGMGVNNDFDKNKAFFEFSDFWEYDPKLDSWKKKADFPGKIFSAASFVLSNKGYVATGINWDDYVKEVWEYNAVTDTWIQKADFPANLREGAFSFVINGKAYMGGGGQPPYYYNDFYEYEPIHDKWIKRADLPEKCSAAAAFSIMNKGYVVAGHSLDGDVFGNSKSCWEYDPSSDTWQKIEDLPGEARSGSFGFSIGNRGYVGGGGSNVQTTFNDFYEYTPPGIKDTIFKEEPTGIQESEKFHIKVFPNPARNIFNIQALDNRIEAVQVYTVLGSLVYSSEGVNDFSDACVSFQIDLCDKPKGIYFIRIKNNNGWIKRKVLLQ